MQEKKAFFTALTLTAIAVAPRIGQLNGMSVAQQVSISQSVTAEGGGLRAGKWCYTTRGLQRY